MLCLKHLPVFPKRKISPFLIGFQNVNDFHPKNKIPDFLEFHFSPAHLPSIWPLYASAHLLSGGFSQRHNSKESTVITTVAPN